MNNNYSNNYEKNTIKVLLIMGNDGSYFNTTKITSLDGDEIYRGFNWDIWNKIQERLQDKYNFEIIESSISKDYDRFVDEVSNGDYDIAISGFTHTSIRQDKVKFCIPHAITSNAVVYKYKPVLIEDFKDIVFILFRILIYLIIIGLFFGIILYIFNPSRKSYSKRLEKNKFLFLLRSIVTGIASVFGEMGYLAERAALNIHGVIITTIIMASCFILIMYFQAEITKIMLTRDNKAINHYNVSKLNLIGHANNADAIKIKVYGANVEQIENLSSKELIDYYLKNSDNYDGCILPYHEAFRYTKEYDGLEYSADFGNEPCSFIVNKENDILFHDINKEISRLREEKVINNICISYFGDIQNIPICSLI